mmetsp:Transcript_26737/g.77838  ORF Transcript_26737/g.77838 Transcript_26737/m.77838 type:complete len:410 (-) Transcript_26737:2636-3865(-)
MGEGRRRHGGLQHRVPELAFGVREEEHLDPTQVPADALGPPRRRSRGAGRDRGLGSGEAPRRDGGQGRHALVLLIPVVFRQGEGHQRERTLGPGVQGEEDGGPRQELVWGRPGQQRLGPDAIRNVLRPVSAEPLHHSTGSSTAGLEDRMEVGEDQVPGGDAEEVTPLLHRLAELFVGVYGPGHTAMSAGAILEGPSLRQSAERPGVLGTGVALPSAVALRQPLFGPRAAGSHEPAFPVAGDPINGRVLGPGRGVHVLQEAPVRIHVRPLHVRQLRQELAAVLLAGACSRLRVGDALHDKDVNGASDALGNPPTHPGALAGLEEHEEAHDARRVQPSLQSENNLVSVHLAEAVRRVDLNAVPHNGALVKDRLEPAAPELGGSGEPMVSEPRLNLGRRGGGPPHELQPFDV